MQPYRPTPGQSDDTNSFNENATGNVMRTIASRMVWEPVSGCDDYALFCVATLGLVWQQGCRTRKNMKALIAEFGNLFL